MFPLTEIQQANIIEAIKQAESLTSGEIKVHVESQCVHENPMKRAQEVFEYLHLHKTGLRNGVLFYLSYEDHKVVVLGDKGINEKVPTGFWDSTLKLLTDNFKKGDFEKGFILGIAEAGKQLQHYFPFHHSDKNEISDDLSIGH